MNIDDPFVSVYMLGSVTKGMGVMDDVMAARIRDLEEEALQDIGRRIRDNAADIAYQYHKLHRIIAYAYQIAAAHDCPAHILDVLSDPEGATEEQIAAMLPYHGGADFPKVI